MAYKSNALASGGGSAGTGGGTISTLTSTGGTITVGSPTGPTTNVDVANNTANTLAGYNNSGIFSDVTIGTNLTLAGGVLNASGSSGGGAVSSVFGRTGAVSANYGDYAFNLISGVASVSQGGTGLQTLSLHGVLLGEGAANISAATTGIAGRLLFDRGGADPAFAVVSGDVSATSTGAMTVLQVHGVAYPASPGTNTVPVVTSSNTITYETVPNAALANSAITIGAQTGLAGGGSVALGSAITLSMGTSVANTLAGYNNSGVFADVSIGTNLNLINSILSGSAISQGSGMTITYSTNTIGLSASGVSAGVSSISNTDGGSLSITPQTGVVTANLNTANANTWTATQTGAVSGGVTSFVSQGCIEFSIFANGNSGTSSTIKWDNGNIQSITISGAASLAFTAPTHPGRLTLIATQDGTGHVYSYTTKILWPGGTVPTWSSGITNTDIASFLYDGANYYGIGNTGFA